MKPVLHLNKDEAMSFTRCPDPEEAGKALVRRTGNTVLITCGAEGCMIFDPPDGSCTRTDPVPAGGNGDAIGAGDSHIGSVIALLQKGYSMEYAVRGANCIASAVVSTNGAGLTEKQFARALRKITSDPDRIQAGLWAKT